MTDLRIDKYKMPAADLGLENPLPALITHTIPQKVRVHENVRASAQKYLGYGCEGDILPYRVQDGYDRTKRDRDFTVAVLENDILRATLLLELGGRLWSLFHKPTQRELLYTNPVFQPGNLAVRNAWFSGGVEWNCAIPGHTPLTCSPMFAARVTADDGSPILRLYEFERLRGVPYQIDFALPEESPLLFAHVRIINPHDRQIPMYWWSNIAVDERPDLRTIAPADWAYNFGGAGMMKGVPIPRDSTGMDVTYSTHLLDSTDYFYDIPNNRPPWITALDADGKGLVQTSTPQLRGRKMFAWGMNPGGRHWEEFLSVPNRPYLEIQAGVAQTQMECFPMAARAELAWVEAYGLLEIDPKLAHSQNWQEALRAVDHRLDEIAPPEMLNARLNDRKLLDRKPHRILHRGNGWGALEEMRRQKAGEASMAPAGLVFDEASLGQEQQPWLDLLRHRILPPRDPCDSPGSFMVQDQWFDILERSTHENGGHWLAQLHLGIMHYHHDRPLEARQAWQRSLELAPSAWALRNLAMQALHDKTPDEACDLYLRARSLMPDLAPLAIESLRILIDNGRSAHAMQLIDRLSPSLRSLGRIEFLRARAALDLGQLDLVEQILISDIQMSELREGELALTDLWYRLQELKLARQLGSSVTDELKQRVRRDFPPPAKIDFRMNRD